jgi:hypothetical protein
MTKSCLEGETVASGSGSIRDGLNLLSLDNNTDDAFSRAAYKLVFSTNTKAHYVFHTSLLNKYVHDSSHM